MQYFPLTWPFILLLGLFLLVLIAVIELGLLKYAYERMGIPPRYVFGVLLLSLLGSGINIPVAQLAPERMVADEYVDHHGMRYVVPANRDTPGTIIAVNVGGALVPVILSIYLLMKNRFWIRAILATAVVTAVVHAFAQPVRGLGISVPTFIPPIVAAVAAMIFGWRHAPPLAYIAGSLGTLIGADLMNLDKIGGLGAPVASIGGAGTFDGIFVTGIIAVLLSPAARPPARDEELGFGGAPYR